MAVFPEPMGSPQMLFEIRANVAGFHFGRRFEADYPFPRHAHPRRRPRATRPWASIEESFRCIFCHSRDSPVRETSSQPHVVAVLAAAIERRTLTAGSMAKF